MIRAKLLHECQFEQISESCYYGAWQNIVTPTQGTVDAVWNGLMETYKEVILSRVDWWNAIFTITAADIENLTVTG